MNTLQPEWRTSLSRFIETTPVNQSALHKVSNKSSNIILSPIVSFGV